MLTGKRTGFYLIIFFFIFIYHGCEKEEEYDFEPVILIINNHLELSIGWATCAYDSTL